MLNKKTIKVYLFDYNIKLDINEYIEIFYKKFID